MKKKLTPSFNACPCSCDGATAPEWLMLPYADVPYNRDGIMGIQRLTLQEASGLVAWFAEEQRTNPKMAAGLPIYVGHPDYCVTAEQSAQWLRNQPPAVGWVKEMRATPDSLQLRVEWTAVGADLVLSRTYKFFSPYLLNEQMPGNIYLPRMMKSCGLSNTPNWPMPPMVNADTETIGGEEGNNMTLLERLIALLADESIKTDDDVVAKIKSLMGTVNAAATEKQTACANAETATAALKKMKQDFATATVNAAIENGQIVAAHKDSRIEDMVNAGDIFAKAKEIHGLPRVMKTVSTVNAERTEAQLAQKKNMDVAIGLVHAEMKATGCSYDAAFSRVKAQKPELFATAQ